MIKFPWDKHRSHNKKHFTNKLSDSLQVLNDVCFFHCVQDKYLWKIVPQISQRLLHRMSYRATWIDIVNVFVPFVQLTSFTRNIFVITSKVTLFYFKLPSHVTFTTPRIFRWFNVGASTGIAAFFIRRHFHIAKWDCLIGECVRKCFCTFRRKVWMRMSFDTLELKY